MSNATTQGARAPFLTTIVLATGTFAMGTDSFVISGILPQVASGFRVSPGAAGQAVTVFALTYAIAGPALAITTSGLKRRGLLLGALALFVVANLFSALAPNLPTFLLSRVLAAIGAAAFMPTASAAATVLAGPSHSGRALAVIYGGLTVGTVFGVPAGTALGQAWGWQASILFVALVALLATFALMATLPELPQPKTVPFRRRLSIMGRPSVLMMVSVNGLTTMGGITVYTYLSTIAASQGLVGDGLIWLLVLAGIGGSAGIFASGMLTDAIGSNRTLLGGSLLLAASLTALGLSHHLWMTLPLVALFSAAGWSPSTPNNARLAAHEPDFPNVAISLNSSAAYLGQAVGALLGGLLLQSGIPAEGLCFAGALIAICAAILQGLTMHLPKSVASLT